jgi:capsular polysaccharide biosynthesis protein
MPQPLKVKLKKLPAVAKLITLRQRARTRLALTLRRLPCSSRLIGPPKGYHVDLKGFAASNPPQGAIIRLHPNLTPPEAVTIPLPVAVFGRGPARYGCQPLKYQADSDFDCLMGGVRIFNAPMTFIAPDDRFIAIFSSFLGCQPEDHVILRKIRLGPVTRVRGRTLFLYDDRNYWHFLHDGLAQLHLMKLAGYELSSFDHVFMTEPPAPYQRDLIKHLGIGPERVFRREGGVQFEFDELLAGSTGWSDRPAPWNFQFLRAAFADAPVIEKEAPRRIYVTRRNAMIRRVANEHDFADLLAVRGFSVVELESLPVFRQIGLFRRADVVVAGAGAGLVNLAFCRPGTRVLVLTNREYQGQEMWLYVCGVLGLPYFSLFGRSLSPGRNAVDADVVYDRNEFQKALDAVC